MKEDRPPETRSAEDRVRALGFDPFQLTPRERDELIDIHTTLLDDRSRQTMAAPRTF